MANAKILIVEDEAPLRRAMKLKFQKKYTIIEAKNGREAWDLMYLQPDLILLDILMPVMDGYKFLKKLRDSGDKTKVIILSNIDPDGEYGAISYEELLKIEHSAILPKAIPLRQIERTITKTLKVV